MFDIDLALVSIMEPNNADVYLKDLSKRRAQNITAIQLSLIDGFVENCTSAPWIINTSLLPLFPKGCKKPIVKTSLIDQPCAGVNHSFLNFSPVYSSSLFLGAKKHLKEWATNPSGKEKVIVAYALTRYTLKAMDYVKRINSDIKTAIIVPDIPELTFNTTKNPLRSLKNSISKSFILKARKQYAKSVDNWILFSEKMAERIPEIRKSMVFEGVATDVFSNIEKNSYSDNVKIILYAGGLNEDYGVKLLIDAFSKLNGNEWRLILAGKGPLENYIRKSAELDSRIVYKGEVPRNELLVLEKNADCLVNPRPNSKIFTRYSFPSKNMEYLSSGTPTVGFKLDGIPDEYDQYINYFSCGTAESLADKIFEVCNSDFYKDRAKKARDFVLQNKNKYFFNLYIILCFFVYLVCIILLHS